MRITVDPVHLIGDRYLLKGRIDPDSEANQESLLNVIEFLGSVPVEDEMTL